MKKTIALLALFLALSLLAACGAEKPAQPSGEALAPETKTEENAEPKSGSEEASTAPEDGERFEGGTFSKMIGSVTLNTEWIPFDEPVVVEDIFEAVLAPSGDSLYVLTDGKVKEFALKDGKLVFESNLPLNDEYEKICSDSSGILYVSDFMRDFAVFENNKQIFAYDGPETVSMHPSGKWGISWFANSDVDIITLGDGTISSEKHKIPEVKAADSIDINENHIIVSGTSVENERKTIFV